MKKSISVIFMSILFVISFQLFAQKKDLKHHLTEEESKMMPEYLKQVKKKTFHTVPVEGVRPIAEFEPSQGVLISYPLGIPLNLIAEMSEDVMVTTIVDNQNQENQVRLEYQSQGVNLSNCNFIHVEHDSYWTRDYGPMFIANNNSIEIVDFTYNRPRLNDNRIPEKLAGFINTNVHKMDLVHCGGNYMSDGISIAISTDLVWEENSSKSHDQINQIMKNYLGVSKYHVTNDPLGEYIKHVDCWGKFLDVDKILITEVPMSNPNYSKYEEIASYFANQNSAWGNKYQIFRVNAPNKEPYTNSLILNDKVLVPITGSSSNDTAALQVYKDAMPGYEVLGFIGSWQTTDALHCRVHEIADIGMLDILHKPILGKVKQQDSYLIQAEIKAYSQQNIYKDSIKVYYRVNEKQYESLKMTSSSNGVYQAHIPKQNLGTTISYYIHAADESGRSEDHPYIGGNDPHVFTIESSDVSVKPVADFSASTTTVQVGETIQFIDSSLNTPTSWEWSFEGGAPLSSSIQNPIVTYNTPGIYKVNLSVSNSEGTDSISKSSFITVSEVTSSYCSSNGDDTSYEWISSVKIGDFNKNSDASVTGYSDYTADIIPVVANNDIAIVLTPGFKSSKYNEYWKIWIDFNKDGDFSDTGEEVFSGKSDAVINATIAIPDREVNTRMRVTMSYQDTFNHCGNFSSGEVEDYQINIKRNNNIITFANNIPFKVKVTPNPNRGSFQLKLDGKKGNKTVILYTLLGKPVYQQTLCNDNGSSLFDINVEGVSEGIHVLKVISDGLIKTVLIQIDNSH
jgi:agmatine/peptidylarginine deiminase/PKD repeat protein